MTGKRTNLWMVLVMLVVGIASLRWSEKLPVGGGFGWDGINYAIWARDFHKSVFVEKLGEYYLQRIAPSGIVHYGTRALLSPFYSQDQIHQIMAEDKNLLLAFDIYNLVILLGSVYLWGLIADKLEITDRGKWFGFCCLFLNYAILKNNFYQPVLTDTSGFVLGILMFYFFLCRNSFGLLAVMIIGGFTWPTIPLMAAILLVFPLPDERETSARRLSPVTVRRLSLLAAAIISVLSLLMFVYLLLKDVPRGWDRVSMVRIDFALLYSSIAAVIVYLLFGCRAAFMDGRLFDIRYVLRAARWRWVPVVVLTLMLLRFTVHQLVNSVPAIWGFQDFALYVFVSSLTEPFIFLVSHAVYYGPVILLLLIFWKPFCERVAQFGIGFRLFVILNLCLSICPQSRYQLAAVGAFVMVLVAVLDRPVFAHWNLALWVLLSIFYSKVWYTFNTSPMNPEGNMASLNSFPVQNLFMNSGPWMSHSMFLVQGSIVLATAALFVFLVVRQRLRPALSGTPASG